MELLMGRNCGMSVKNLNLVKALLNLGEDPSPRFRVEGFLPCGVNTGWHVLGYANTVEQAKQSCEGIPEDTIRIIEIV